MIDNYIHIDTRIRSGEPTVKNTRLSVLDVVLGIHYDGFESYLKDHELTNEIGCSVLKYCSSKSCLRTESIKFCDKCVFGRLQSGETFQSLTKEYDKIIVSENDQSKIIYSRFGNEDLSLDSQTLNFLGSEEEFWEETEGFKGWEIAKSLIDNKY